MDPVRHTSGEFTKRSELAGAGAVSGMSRTGISTDERAVADTAFDFSSGIPDLVALQECTVVLVDTETTGFGSNADIIQIAARCGNGTFEAYMLPNNKIHPKASEKTGLSMVNGELLYHGSKVTTSPSADVARDFIEFLKSWGSQILIVGHNVIRFDAPIILKWLNVHGLAKTMCSLLYGFTDTVPLLRQGKVGKLEVLAQQYLIGPEWQSVLQAAHNAASDCLILSGLLRHFGITDSILKENAVTTNQFMERLAMLNKQEKNLPFLIVMEQHGVSRNMLLKMAMHDITINLLRTEFALRGREGIEACLGERVDGRPRVTTADKIITSVCDYLKSENQRSA